MYSQTSWCVFAGCCWVKSVPKTSRWLLWLLQSPGVYMEDANCCNLFATKVPAERFRVHHRLPRFNQFKAADWDLCNLWLLAGLQACTTGLINWFHSSCKKTPATTCNWFLNCWSLWQNTGWWLDVGQVTEYYINCPSKIRQDQLPGYSVIHPGKGFPAEWSVIMKFW